ncbi:MAG: NUDIX hydrolase [Spirochaetota bacterium]
MELPMEKWTILSRKKIMQRAVFSVSDMECEHASLGISHTFSIIDAPDWINVVAQTENGELILVRQHRLGTDEITWETPAGMIEKGEDPRCAAERELSEETGYTAKEIVLMSVLRANPAIMTNRIHFFLAKGCTEIQKQNLDREEDISVELRSVRQVQDMIHSGQIDHSIIVTALSLFLLSEKQQSVTEGL